MPGLEPGTPTPHLSEMSRRRNRPWPDLAEERLLLDRTGIWPMGIDEAGRGPWAGPVVSAAVRLDPEDVPDGLDDSKRLSPNRRAGLNAAIRASASVGVGLASVEEIDRLNIHRATLLAMRRAATALAGPPVALVDGRFMPDGIEGTPIPKGDARCASIAAASIVAKVARDTIMRSLGQQHPPYHWEQNKGYGTQEHRAALLQHGPTQHHRRSFAPIRNMLCPD